MLNQIDKPTATPTMRWVFQLFEGVNYVTVNIKDVTTHGIEGLNALRIKIIDILGGEVKKIYQISSTGG